MKRCIKYVKYQTRRRWFFVEPKNMLFGIFSALGILFLSFTCRDYFSHSTHAHTILLSHHTWKSIKRLERYNPVSQTDKHTDRQTDVQTDTLFANSIFNSGQQITMCYINLHSHMFICDHHHYRSKWTQQWVQHLCFEYKQMLNILYIHKHAISSLKNTIVSAREGNKIALFKIFCCSVWRKANDRCIYADTKRYKYNPKRTQPRHE